MPKASSVRGSDKVLIALMLAGSVLFQFHSLLKPARAGEAVAVVFAPWVGAKAAIERVAGSDARVIRPGGLPFIVIAQADSVEVAARLGELGAMFTLDPVAISACLDAFRA
ncbi:MAG: hypothetical protein ABW198_04410 [Pseudorhodoplanes sp.]